MLQDNPYPTDNNPQGGWPPAPEPPGGTNPPSGGGYMPPEPPSMPPPVINPLGETNLNTTPMSPMSSGPDIDLGESSRKSPQSKQPAKSQESLEEIKYPATYQEPGVFLIEKR